MIFLSLLVPKPNKNNNLSKPHLPPDSIEELAQRILINLPSNIKANDLQIQIEKEWLKLFKLAKRHFDKFMENPFQDLLIISGPWGSGKTSFVNIALNKYAQNPHYHIINISTINYDNIAQLKQELLSSIYAEIPYIPRLCRRLKHVANTISLNIPASVTPLTIQAQLLKATSEATAEFKKFIETYWPSEKILIITVDELDRVRPHELYKLLKIIYYLRSFRIKLKLIIPVDLKIIEKQTYYIVERFTPLKSFTNEQKEYTKSQIENFLEKFFTNKVVINLPAFQKIFELYVRLTLSQFIRKPEKGLIYGTIFCTLYFTDKNEVVTHRFFNNIANNSRSYFQGKQYQNPKDPNMVFDNFSFITKNLQDWIKNVKESASITNPLTLQLDELPSLQYGQWNLLEWENVIHDIRDFFIKQLYETVNTVFEDSYLANIINLRILIGQFEQLKPYLLEVLTKKRRHNKNYIFPYGAVWEKLDIWEKLDKRIAM